MPYKLNPQEMQEKVSGQLCWETDSKARDQNCWVSPSEKVSRPQSGMARLNAKKTFLQEVRLSKWNTLFYAASYLAFSQPCTCDPPIWMGRS